MYIHEAINIALKTDACITRKKWCGNLRIKPTNTSECCIVDNKIDPPRRGWEPFAKDLVVNDWVVIKNCSNYSSEEFLSDGSDPVNCQFDKSLIQATHKYALRIMEKPENPQEIAILPELLKFIQTSTK